MYKQDISVVIGSFNRKKYLKLTIDTVRKELVNSRLDYEIIIVDGGSTDGTLKWLLKQKDIITIIQHNRGKWLNKEIVRRSWGYFMNFGFKSAQGKYICMLSDDCLVIQGAIINGYNHAEKSIKAGEKIGGIAFYWRNWPEQEKYWVGLTLGNKMFVNHGLYLKQALEDVGYIDEENYIFYHADGDLGLKMWQQNYKCIDSPNSYIEHFSDANTTVRRSNNKTQPKDWDTYLNKWDGVLYKKSSKEFGSWIEKEYNDNLNTYRAFDTPFSKILQNLIYHEVNIKMKQLLKLFGVRYLYNKLLLIRNYSRFLQEFKIFQSTHGERFSVRKKDQYPCMDDKTAITGFDKHYLYHPAWAARKLKEISPKKHIDISSKLDFSTFLSAFIPVEFYDYRPANIELDNLICKHADITALPFADNSIESISSMHVIEHIGLARYGDPLDVDGDLKAIEELKRVIVKGGHLLFVVPIGGEAKIMFNAHRIYSYAQVLSYFENFRLIEFSLIPDKSEDGIIINATKQQSDLQNYACGCFLLKKG